MITVTLFNRHAMCGIAGRGRYPRAAYRDAVQKAGKHFLNYRGEAADCPVDNYAGSVADFDPLFEAAFAGMKRKRTTRSCSHSDGPFTVEVRRPDYWTWR